MHPASCSIRLSLMLLLLAHFSQALAQTSQSETEESPGLLELMAETPESALQPHEPIYFVVGSGKDEDLKARFQFSFKYQLLDRQSDLVTNHPWLGHLYLSYTQTSLWNWSEDSVPFEDTSYKPSVFFETGESRIATGMRFGYYHESNGQADAESRSMDTLFIQPVWGTRVFGRDLFFSPRILAYLTKGDENPDLTDYRGYVDYNLRYGNEDGLILQTLYRYGKGGHHTVQLDVTYPLRTAIALRTGGFVFLQLYSGYGESMLSYNERVDLIARIGFGIVR